MIGGVPAGLGAPGGPVLVAVSGLRRRFLGWLTTRSVAAASLSGVGVATAVCAAAWFTAGTRAASVTGGLALGAGYLAALAARQLAARAGGRVGEAGRARWLAALAMRLSDGAVVAGLALGAIAEGWSGIWPLAIALLGLIAVRDTLATCGTPSAGRPADGRSPADGVRQRAEPVHHMVMTMLAMPPGGRVLLIAVAAPAWGARASLIGLLDWAIIAAGFGIGGIAVSRWRQRAGRPSQAPRRDKASRRDKVAPGDEAHRRDQTHRRDEVHRDEAERRDTAERGDQAHRPDYEAARDGRPVRKARRRTAHGQTGSSGVGMLLRPGRPADGADIQAARRAGQPIPVLRMQLSRPPPGLGELEAAGLADPQLGANGVAGGPADGETADGGRAAGGLAGIGLADPGLDDAAFDDAAFDDPRFAAAGLADGGLAGLGLADPEFSEAGHAGPEFAAPHPGQPGPAQPGPAGPGPGQAGDGQAGDGRPPAEEASGQRHPESEQAGPAPAPARRGPAAGRRRAPLNLTVARCRDDGAISRWFGRLAAGQLVPLPAALLALAAVGMLARLGLQDLPGLLILAPAIVMLVAAPGSSHPHNGLLDWLVPAVLQGAQYVYIAALGFAARVPGPLTFALCAAIALRYADLGSQSSPVLPPRRRAAGGTPPGRLPPTRLAPGQLAPERGAWMGWEGRMILCGAGAALGIATFAYAALAAYVAGLVCAKFMAGRPELPEEVVR